MAQHKAPTSVTIAPLAEKSGLAAFVDRYWKLAALLAAALTAFLLYQQHSRTSARELVASQWAKVLDVAKPDPRWGMLSGKPGELMAIADLVKGSQAGPWALYIAAGSAARDGQFEQAKQALVRLRQEYPTHPLVADRVASEPSAPRQSLVESLEARLDSLSGWRAQNPSFFANPTLPAGAPRIKFNTDRGSFVLGLHSDLAPRHCENLLKLAREGAYNGIRFHRVKANALVQAGDPNTLKEDTAAWGTGEVGSKLDAEPNGLRHFAGTLAGARTPGSKQSSGSQFFVNLADNHEYDGEYTVFGTVVEGLDILQQLSQVKVVDGTERPETPPVIQSTEVL